MLSTAQTATGGALVLLAAAIAWLLLTELPVIDLGKATTTASPLIVLEAAVPSIGDFADFNVNTENPFIPFNLRTKEVVAIKEAKAPRPPKVPSVPQVDPPKPRELPRLPSATTTGPRATGVLISKDGVQALLTFPGQAKAALMRPGDTVNGWTLTEVIDGNILRMKEDATGTTHNLVVPESIAVHKPAPKALKPDGKSGTPDGKSDGKSDGKWEGKPDGKNPDGKPHPLPSQPGADRPLPQIHPPQPPEKLM